MKTHNGMRPQDIVVLLKILLYDKGKWQFRDLAGELLLSTSEISESLTRSFQGGLVDDTKRSVFRQSLMEFIEYGLRHVFPQQTGAMVTGMPTGHSHPFFKPKFSGEYEFVWPFDEGKSKGVAIIPLYRNAPKAVAKDEQLYKALAAVDMVRAARPREVKVALDVLRKIIL